MYIFKFTFCLFLLLFLTGITDAQKRISHDPSDLMSGTLIVRLPTNSKLIHHYESKGNHNKAEEIRNSIDKLNKDIYRAFSEEYTFSDLGFVFGDDLNSDALNRDASFRLLNENLEVDEIIEIDSRNIFYLDLSEYQEFKNRAYVLDYQFNRIPKPFPTGNISRLKIGFAGLKSDEDKLKEIAFKLNHRLNKAIY